MRSCSFASRSGRNPVRRSPSNPTSTRGSCPGTKRSRTGGMASYFVSISFDSGLLTGSGLIEQSSRNPVSQVIFAVIASQVWHTGFPVSAFFAALLLALAYSLPVGIILAITNQKISLGVTSSVLIGYWLPGNALVSAISDSSERSLLKHGLCILEQTSLLFKTYSNITMYQALTFTSDMKLGHYMKIPPRTMFWGQVWATCIAGTVQLCVQSWMFASIPGMCDDHQPAGYVSSPAVP